MEKEGGEEERRGEGEVNEGGRGERCVSQPCPPPPPPASLRRINGVNHPRTPLPVCYRYTMGNIRLKDDSGGRGRRVVGVEGL